MVAALVVETITDFYYKEVIKTILAVVNTEEIAIDLDNDNSVASATTKFLTKQVDIAITTRRGTARHIVAHPSTEPIINAIRDRIDAHIDNVTYNENVPENSAIMAYKGNTPYDAGIVVCPYILNQALKATTGIVNPYTFNPYTPEELILGNITNEEKIGVRTRFGMFAHNVDKYYKLVKFV